MLCLNTKYRKTKKCAKLDADGFAHHAYTTAKGPRFIPPDRRDVTLGVLSRLTVALDKAGKAKALPRGLPIYLTEFGIQSRPDRIQGVSFAKQAAYLSIAEHMAYVNPRVRSFSQYLMADDPKRASDLNPYAGFESGLRTNKGKKKPAYKAFRLPLAVEAYGPSDVLWGLVRQNRAKTKVTIEIDPPGKKKPRKFRTLSTTEQRRVRAARHAREGPEVPRAVDLAGRQDLRRRLGPRLLSVAPGHPSYFGRTSDWGLAPMGRPWRLADSPNTMRTLRMHLLGLDVTDAHGTSLGQVVDTYPFDGGGELEMIVLRLRRFGERRMLPVSELRLDEGRLVAPFTRRQIEDSPVLDGRRIEDDPWRSKSYWFWEDPVTAVRL